MTKSGIYCVQNKLNGKVYVGSSIDVVFRLKNHRYHLLNGDHENEKLQRAWMKYGPNNFQFIIIYECYPRVNIYLEQLFIDLFDAVDCGYNINRIANSRLGHTPSDETRKKISDTLRGKRKKPFSDEHKANISKARLGMKFSEEHKAALSRSHKLYKRTDEHSGSLKKVQQSDEYRRRHSRIMKESHAKRGNGVHSKAIKKYYAKKGLADAYKERARDTN